MNNDSTARPSSSQPAELTHDVDAVTATDGRAQSPVQWIPGDVEVAADALRMIEQVVRARRQPGRVTTADSPIVVLVDETPDLLRRAAAETGRGTTVRDVLAAMRTPEPVWDSHTVFGNRVTRVPPLMQRMAADPADVTSVVLGDGASAAPDTLDAPPPNR
ncbi:hypothetical protein [Amycolatopsis saalfeldensis]|uniref:Uncharacterized protein n=1 Tax=Amycolatopsis saalfeldensis TaxID=394193 RepID=A0A1H8YN64_9PSEU|nr:hypothetical protein [Amycolatopsis saalfeldensis]SEP53599.1 hypothetical protein SAMN04489732_12924 [Amycolatopsis saalfeldensis]